MVDQSNFMHSNFISSQSIDKSKSKTDERLKLQIDDVPQNVFIAASTTKNASGHVNLIPIIREGYKSNQSNKRNNNSRV
jgi:hypothetical protein